MPLLQVQELTKSFAAGRRGRLQALRGVTLTLEQGQSLGLVGESGCGKSTLARCVVRLLQPDAGRILLSGRDLAPLSERALRPLRRQLQMIFQDPDGSLDPRLTLEQIVTEPLVAQSLVRGRAERARRAASLLEQVGLSDTLRGRFPHQLSGGQRQRVAIARALATRPRLVVADEPLSALDLPVQAQVLDLLADLREQQDLSYLIISHDLRLLLGFCHQVAVMYLGSIVEQGPAQQLASSPAHPYTRALLAATPELTAATPELLAATPELTAASKPAPLAGEVPSPLCPPPGCPFHPRCRRFAERPLPACASLPPALQPICSDHLVACHQAEG